MPTVLTLHTTGMAVLVGASWLLDLRLLGINRNVPLTAYRWVFRAVAIGLIVNLLTGVLLFMKNATTWGTALPFLVKMLFVVASAATILPIRKYVLNSGQAPQRDQQQRSPVCDRLDRHVDRCRDCGPSARLPGPIARPMESFFVLNAAHLHLVLNHVPTLGMPWGWLSCSWPSSDVMRSWCMSASRSCS